MFLLIALKGISQVSYTIDNKPYYCLDTFHTRILGEVLVQAEIDSIKAKCLQDYVDQLDTTWTNCDSILSTTNSIITNQEQVIAQDQVVITNCKNNISKLNNENHKFNRLTRLLGGYGTGVTLLLLLIVL